MGIIILAFYGLYCAVAVPIALAVKKNVRSLGARVSVYTILIAIPLADTLLPTILFKQYCSTHLFYEEGEPAKGVKGLYSEGVNGSCPHCEGETFDRGYLFVEGQKLPESNKRHRQYQTFPDLEPGLYRFSIQRVDSTRCVEPLKLFERWDKQRSWCVLAEPLEQRMARYTYVESRERTKEPFLGDISTLTTTIADTLKDRVIAKWNHISWQGDPFVGIHYGFWRDTCFSPEPYKARNGFINKYLSPKDQTVKN